MLRTSTLVPHNCRITKSALLLPKETYYYLEEEAHVAHQRVVAAHGCRSPEAPCPPPGPYFGEDERPSSMQGCSIDVDCLPVFFIDRGVQGKAVVVVYY